QDMRIWRYPRIGQSDIDDGHLAAEANHNMRFTLFLGGDETVGGDGGHRVIQRIELGRGGNIARSSIAPSGADNNLLLFLGSHEPLGRPNFQTADLGVLDTRSRSAIL